MSDGPAVFEVSAAASILRPLDEVQRQFGDVGYHQRTGHHRGVRFVVRVDEPERCDYEQITRVGPIRLRQEIRLDRADGAHQVNTIVAGPFSPGTITFDITPEGDDVTRVVATLQAERRGVVRLAAPILKRQLRRSLRAALDEDRDDLESERYAGATGTSTSDERGP